MSIILTDDDSFNHRNMQIPMVHHGPSPHLSFRHMFESSPGHIEYPWNPWPIRVRQRKAEESTEEMVHARAVYTLQQS